MRAYPPACGPEQAQLTAFLDTQRETVLLKADGLEADQLARPLAPSSLTLAGLLNHLARVEDLWFQVRFAGRHPDPLWAGVDWAADPDHDFRTAVDVPPEELRRRYLDAIGRSRETVKSTDTLDQRSVRPRSNGQYVDLRWVLLHLIEETARHAGHADLLREAIDGSVGDQPPG
ncbi:DinB family protein [Candidatus Blastococcus massiliensis]|uniref:DinB family protein n=1 Tax=Candidatus Blastococcus massiliensis TaxID=1470358 RepID=UPI0004B61CDE|nr:DinB family protein [Candidatus Blastococcus massiliensis]